MLSSNARLCSFDKCDSIEKQWSINSVNKVSKLAIERKKNRIIEICLERVC